VNGSEKRRYDAPVTTQSISLPLGCNLRLAVNDVLKFEVIHDQGTSRLFVNGVNYNFIDIAKIG